MNVLSTNLPHSADAIGTARQLVNEHTISLGVRQREDAALMVSELATNAVQHGVGAISLRIDVNAGGAGRGSRRGERCASGEPAARGSRRMGLRIVEQLADDWGVLEGRTTVWFQLARPHPQR
jgi:two-component sensor histidine kinase